MALSWIALELPSCFKPKLLSGWVAAQQNRRREADRSWSLRLAA